MTNLRNLTKSLQAAREELESLSVGYAIDATAADVAALLEVAQTLAKLVEDETDRRFTRLDSSEIEDVVDGWFDAADKVAARRGEA